MNDFEFNCPHCEQWLEAPQEMMGETIDCPSCNGSIELPKPAAQAERETPPEPETKNCPFCAETILATAVKCKHCGEFLNGQQSQPLTKATIRRLRNGGLVSTYGRPKSTFRSLEAAADFDYVAEHSGHCGKFVMIDPSGTGNNWQGRIDLHELEIALQAQMGVPENERLRVQEDTNVRDSNSWEYLSLNEVEDDVLLVTYDVQRFRENWNSHPVYGVRMVRVAVER